MKYSLELYYKEKAAYANKIPSIKKALEKILDGWQIPYKIIESQELSKEDTERLKMKFRDIQPQKRGSIVATEGKFLPLSGKKNLNLENTPILVIVCEGKYINVYPHLKGKKYIDVKTALEEIFKIGLTNSVQIRESLEEPIVDILSENPELLGDGLKFIGSEVDVGSGKPDIVFEDSDGRIVIVEVKTRADDSTIGQVSRQAEGYSRNKGCDIKDIRKVIICLSAKKNLVFAASSAEIELYKLELRREK